MRTAVLFLSVLIGCTTPPKQSDTGEEDESETETEVETDADGDGVAAIEDCNDNDSALGAIVADRDCDGAVTDEDCDDSTADLGSVWNDRDCDGILSADDCDDFDPAATTVASDFDCDGIVTTYDCDDRDPSVGATNDDKDCDGALTEEDCDDSDPSLGAVADDGDCDGISTADDCDDTDASSTVVATDADCDGTLTADDCDDTDASSTTIATDADCDGEPDGCPEGFQVLTYYDSFSVPLTAGAAATMGGTETHTSSGTEFASLYDSADWHIVVIDVPGSSLPTEVQDRIYDRITTAKPLIFSWWDLDTDAALATELGVTTLTFSTPRSIHSTDETILFSLVEMVPDPISGYSDDAGDNGDVVNPIDDSAIVHAVFDGDSDAAAITQTNDGSVLVNGFLPWDFQETDDDADSLLDMEELYINEFTLMCR